MNILFLEGPNLNLLGLKSSQNGNKLTLDKLNRSIRTNVHNKGITLKILQTHKQYKALNFLQRNRNWADGVLFIPTSWAIYEWAIADTLNLISLPTAVVYFEEPYVFGGTISDSIIKGEKIQSFSGQPLDSTLNGLNYLLSHK